MQSSVKLERRFLCLSYMQDTCCRKFANLVTNTQRFVIEEITNVKHCHISYSQPVAVDDKLNSDHQLVAATRTRATQKCLWVVDRPWILMAVCMYFEMKSYFITDLCVSRDWLRKFGKSPTPRPCQTSRIGGRYSDCKLKIPTTHEWILTWLRFVWNSALVCSDYDCVQSRWERRS